MDTKTNINTNERGNMSLNVVVWFINTDADSEKNTTYFF